MAEFIWLLHLKDAKGMKEQENNILHTNGKRQGQVLSSSKDLLIMNCVCAPKLISLKVFKATDFNELMSV